MNPEPIHLTVFADPDVPVLGNPHVLYRLPDLTSEQYLVALALRHPGIDVGFIAIAGDLIKIRWFNGANEIQFCGHGALAAAWWLQQSGIHLHQFQSPAGTFESVNSDSLLGIKATMLQPVPLAEADLFVPGLPENCLARYIERQTQIVLIECSDQYVVQQWQPDFERLLAMDPDSIGALILFSRADQNFAGYFRYFAPWYGKNEDIATGSALRVLAPLFDGESLRIRQLSKLGGVLTASHCAADSLIISGQVFRSNSLP